MSDHTKEPWRIDATKALGPMGIYSANEEVEQELSGVCWFNYARNKVNGKCQTRETIEANARRICACVNACAGIDTATLEAAPSRTLAEVARLCAEEGPLLLAARDLLAACEQAEHCIDATVKGGQLALDMIRAALAKAEGATP